MTVGDWLNANISGEGIFLLVVICVYFICMCRTTVVKCDCKTEDE